MRPAGTSLKPPTGDSARRAHPYRAFALQLGFLLGMWILFVVDATSARNQAREDAIHSLSNVAASLAIDLSHALELLDRSLQGVVNEWQNDEIRALKPSLRHLVLFDPSMSAEAFGPVVVLDPYGSVLARSDEEERDPYGSAAKPSDRPQKTNDTYAGRWEFKIQVEGAAHGLYVGQGFLNTEDGQWSIPVSRRMTTPDGAFAGVVAGTLKMSYVQGVYDRIGLRSGALLALGTDDGLLLARRPMLGSGFGNAPAKSINGQIGHSRTEGVYQARSKLDGVEKLYSFHRVGHLPLVQYAGMPTADVYADWRERTSMMGGLLAVLSVGILLLQLMLGRELRSRIAAETMLEELASRDPLTGIANRRVFDAALEREWQLAIRRGSAVGLLMIDVDHFKGYNDLYGHLGGDDVLRTIAARIGVVSERLGGLACRFGGEEFAVLLPAMVAVGAHVAQDLVREIRDCALPSAASPSGIITISVGVAAAVPYVGDPSGSLIASADRQLYLAKSNGRDCCSVASVCRYVAA